MIQTKEAIEAKINAIAKKYHPDIEPEIELIYNSGLVVASIKWGDYALDIWPENKMVYFAKGSNAHRYPAAFDYSGVYEIWR